MCIVWCVVFFKTAFYMAYDLSCEICGSTMIERNCKIKCPNCGFTRDCSDP
jgi:rubrerythrin